MFISFMWSYIIYVMQTAFDLFYDAFSVSGLKDCIKSVFSLYRFHFLSICMFFYQLICIWYVILCYLMKNTLGLPSCFLFLSDNFRHHTLFPHLLAGYFKHHALSPRLLSNYFKHYALFPHLSFSLFIFLLVLIVAR